MNLQQKDTVLITGATGGLGTHIVREFANCGMRLALTAYPGTDLDDLKKLAEDHGCECAAYVSDLRIREDRQQLVDSVLERFGRVDILVNNAGVEFTSYYHELSEDNILDVLKVNLEAPMILTRLLLPQMLKKHRGHVVNISSLAGKAGPALQEPYASTKAGLIAFTCSLRASYQGTGVSASVIVPGFVETGIYTKLKENSGCSAPALLGTSSPETVARALLQAIRKDMPETIINPLPIRPLLALTALFPSLGEWIIGKTGGHDFFRQVVEAQKRGKKQKS